MPFVIFFTSLIKVFLFLLASCSKFNSCLLMWATRQWKVTPWSFVAMTKTFYNKLSLIILTMINWISIFLKFYSNWSLHVWFANHYSTTNFLNNCLQPILDWFLFAMLWPQKFTWMSPIIGWALSSAFPYNSTLSFNSLSNLMLLNDSSFYNF